MRKKKKKKMREKKKKKKKKNEKKKKVTFAWWVVNRVNSDQSPRSAASDHRSTLFDQALMYFT